MSMRNRKRVQWWVALMLPAVMLRALIPVGFMPLVGPGYSVRMVLCDGYAPLPWTSQSMPMSMPMPMPTGASDHEHPADGEHSGKTPSHHHASCVYGSSPAFAALPELHLPAVVPQSPDLVTAAPQAAYAASFTRAHSARGPPV